MIEERITCYYIADFPTCMRIYVNISLPSSLHTKLLHKRFWVICITVHHTWYFTYWVEVTPVLMYEIMPPTSDNTFKGIWSAKLDPHLCLCYVRQNAEWQNVTYPPACIKQSFIDVFTCRIWDNRTKQYEIFVILRFPSYRCLCWKSAILKCPPCWNVRHLG